VVLYLDDSANPVDPVIECSFQNAGNIVMNTVRQGLVIYGPRIDVHVDRATCDVTSP
jgi:hypothetical protein